MFFAVIESILEWSNAAKVARLDYFQETAYYQLDVTPEEEQQT